MEMRNPIISLLATVWMAGAVDLPKLDQRPGKWLNLNSQAAVSNSALPTVFFVFTRDCGNCHRSHKFVNELQAKYGKRLRIIGIHSPEFAWEKDPEKLKAYLARNGIRYPIYLDADMQTWAALENRYWPAFFLFDKSGRYTATFVGETHPADSNARTIEAAATALLQ